MSQDGGSVAIIEYGRTEIQRILSVMVIHLVERVHQMKECGFRNDTFIIKLMAYSFSRSNIRRRISERNSIVGRVPDEGNGRDGGRYFFTLFQLASCNVGFADSFSIYFSALSCKYPWILESISTLALETCIKPNRLNSQRMVVALMERVSVTIPAVRNRTCRLMSSGIPGV